MSMNDDFGAPDEAPGSDRSQTPEDATLHGQPVDEQPGTRDASNTDAATGTSDDPVELEDLP
jgi:hypothetical protein